MCVYIYNKITIRIFVVKKTFIVFFLNSYICIYSLSQKLWPFQVYVQISQKCIRNFFRKALMTVNRKKISAILKLEHTSTSTFFVRSKFPCPLSWCLCLCFTMIILFLVFRLFIVLISFFIAFIPLIPIPFLPPFFIHVFLFVLTAFHW